MTSAMVDKAWFETQMRARGLSLRKLARNMAIDPSALSRALNSQRKLKPEEISRLSEILGHPAARILEHITVGQSEGFAEMPQPKLGTPALSPAPADAQPMPPVGKVQHPAFGALKGMITLLPSVDYTEPADPEWGKVYED